MLVEQSTRVMYVSYKTIEFCSETLNGEIFLYGN
jgi:hypothetical protein